MTWQFLIVISVITYSFSILIQKKLLKDNKVDPVAFSILFQIFVGVVIFLYTAFRGFYMPPVQNLPLNFIFMMILYGAGNVFVFKSLQTGEASQFTIIFTTRMIWTILAAMAFLDESFSVKQSLGALLIVSSVILVSWTKRGLQLSKSALFALGAASCYGLAFTNDAFIIRSSDVPSYLVIAFLVPALFVWLIYPSSTLSMRHFFTKSAGLKMTVLSILYSLSAITIFLAYQVGRNAAQIAPLSQTSAVLTVLLAIFLLGERKNLVRKVGGAVLSLIGVVLLL